MTQNLEIRAKPHAVSAANRRGVCFLSAVRVVQNTPYVKSGNKYLREEFIGMGLVEGQPYPIVVPCSAGTNGDDAWHMIETVYPDRKYKKLFSN